MAKKPLGWVGYVDNKPYWEKTVDTYVASAILALVFLILFLLPAQAKASACGASNCQPGHHCSYCPMMSGGYPCGCPN